MVQGNNKEYIFEKNSYKELYKTLVLTNAKKFDIMPVAYCIMGNHAHLLMESEDFKNISNCMHKVNTMYAMKYNEREKRVGNVLRGRFKAEPIETVEYLYNCILYIQNNPVKAHIVEKASEYRYSSYNDYKQKNGIVNNRLINKIFNDNDSFFEIMKNKENLEYEFLEYEERKKSLEELVEEYVRNKNTTLQNIITNEISFKEFIKTLRREKISISQISNLTKINRTKISKLSQSCNQARPNCKIKK